MNLSLFIVVLGGRSLKSNIEIHDVRWVLGESLEDTFPELRKQWIGKSNGLHIDSYKRIEYVCNCPYGVRSYSLSIASLVQGKYPLLIYLEPILHRAFLYCSLNFSLLIQQ